MDIKPINDLSSFGKLVQGNPISIKVGDVYGRLKAVEYQGANETRLVSIWLWLCECGNYIYVRGTSVKNGVTSSCGCYQRETTSKRAKTHGMTNSTEFGIWSKIKKRCTNESDKGYHRYGGRGITMDPEWFNSFEAFYRDMGPRPSVLHSIDRKNNNLGYNKDNCRWATIDVQTTNRSTSRYLEHNSEIMTIIEFSRRLKTSDVRILQLLRVGYSVDEIVYRVTNGDRKRKLNKVPKSDSEIFIPYDEMIKRKSESQ